MLQQVQVTTSSISKCGIKVVTREVTQLVKEVDLPTVESPSTAQGHTKKSPLVNIAAVGADAPWCPDSGATHHLTNNASTVSVFPLHTRGQVKFLMVMVVVYPFLVFVCLHCSVALKALMLSNLVLGNMRVQGDKMLKPKHII